MKRSQVFPSTYLGKDDVPSPTTASIQDVRMETIKGDGSEEEKAVLHFAGNNLKPMILNNTNWVTLEEAYGDESDHWRGKTVEIYIDPGVMFGGKRVGGVRLRVSSVTRNGNNHPATGLTWEQAIIECAKAGINKDGLIAHLKSKGRAGYNSARDTHDIRDLISFATTEQQQFAPDSEGPSESDIPF